LTSVKLQDPEAKYPERARSGDEMLIASEDDRSLTSADWQGHVSRPTGYHLQRLRYSLVGLPLRYRRQLLRFSVGGIARL